MAYSAGTSSEAQTHSEYTGKCRPKRIIFACCLLSIFDSKTIQLAEFVVCIHVCLLRVLSGHDKFYKVLAGAYTEPSK